MSDKCTPKHKKSCFTLEGSQPYTLTKEWTNSQWLSPYLLRVPAGAPLMKTRCPYCQQLDRPVGTINNGVQWTWGPHAATYE